MCSMVSDCAAVRKASLYVFESPLGVVKIGVSVDPFERLTSLLTGHPVMLTVRFRAEMDEPIAYKVESCVHNLLKGSRTQGEWFAISSGKAIEAINNVLHIIRQVSDVKFKIIGPIENKPCVQKTVGGVLESWVSKNIVFDDTAITRPIEMWNRYLFSMSDFKVMTKEEFFKDIKQILRNKWKKTNVGVVYKGVRLI